MAQKLAMAASEQKGRVSTGIHRIFLGFVCDAFVSFVVVIMVLFLETISLPSPNCPGTDYGDQAGLQLTDTDLPL